MYEIEAGMLAWSKAGHDKDKLYLIIAVEGDCVYLADGRLRPLEHPKKKKKKHVQIIKEKPEELSLTELKNEDIRRIIKEDAYQEVRNV